MTYYEKNFTELIAAGAPKWWLRLYTLSDLALFSHNHFFHSEFNPAARAHNGWFTSSATCHRGTYFGVMHWLGAPTWDEYRLLFDGGEYADAAAFRDEYETQRAGWLQTREMQESICAR